MKKLSVVVCLLALVLFSTIAYADGFRRIREALSGYEEVPALSTPGNGLFRAKIGSSEITYRLSYSDLESTVTQAHIHFESKSNNGPIVVFLCSNLPNPPAGTQACPPAPATITGTITAANVGAGAAAAGIAAGEFDEFKRAVRAGATYVNVHTTGRPGGEIRSQIDGVQAHDDSDDDDDDHDH